MGGAGKRVGSRGGTRRRPVNEEAAKEVAKVVEGGRSATRGRVRGIHESQMRWIRPSLPYFCFQGRRAGADYCESSAVGEAGARVGLGIK